MKIEYKKFSWTKYGSRKGLVKEDLKEWSCQLCGQKHTGDMPSYFVPGSELAYEFYRLCSTCLHTANTLSVKTFDTLLNMKVANMLTLPAKY